MYRRIRELREDRDWSQANVAKELNCSQQVYSNYELGQRDIPHRGAHQAGKAAPHQRGLYFGTDRRKIGKTEAGRDERCGCAGSFDHRSKEEKP